LGHPVEGAFLLVLFSASKGMESYAQETTRRSIAALTQELPTEAVALVCGERRVMAIGEIRAGTLLLVRPGERVPVDTIVVDGASEVDLSAMTGEADPRPVQRGDEVPSGGV